MAEEMRKDEKKERARKNIDPAATGSQIGLGGSEGLGGSYVKGAGSDSGMSSVSSSYENMPERGTGTATGSKSRRSGNRTVPER